MDPASPIVHQPQVYRGPRQCRGRVADVSGRRGRIDFSALVRVDFSWSELFALHCSQTGVVDNCNSRRACTCTCTYTRFLLLHSNVTCKYFTASHNGVAVHMVVRFTCRRTRRCDAVGETRLTQQIMEGSPHHSQHPTQKSV